MCQVSEGRLWLNFQVMFANFEENKGKSNLWMSFPKTVNQMDQIAGFQCHAI